jgi:hypothetical protein
MGSGGAVSALSAARGLLASSSQNQLSDPTMAPPRYCPECKTSMYAQDEKYEERGRRCSTSAAMATARAQSAGTRSRTRCSCALERVANTSPGNSEARSLRAAHAGQWRGGAVVRGRPPSASDRPCRPSVIPRQPVVGAIAAPMSRSRSAANRWTSAPCQRAVFCSVHPAVRPDGARWRKVRQYISESIRTSCHSK